MQPNQVEKTPKTPKEILFETRAFLVRLNQAITNQSVNGFNNNEITGFIGECRDRIAEINSIDEQIDPTRIMELSQPLHRINELLVNLIKKDGCPEEYQILNNQYLPNLNYAMNNLMLPDEPTFLNMIKELNIDIRNFLNNKESTQNQITNLTTQITDLIKMYDRIEARWLGSANKYNRANKQSLEELANEVSQMKLALFNANLQAQKQNQGLYYALRTLVWTPHTLDYSPLLQAIDNLNMKLVQHIGLGASRTIGVEPQSAISVTTTGTTKGELEEEIKNLKQQLADVSSIPEAPAAPTVGDEADEKDKDEEEEEDEKTKAFKNVRLQIEQVTKARKERIDRPLTIEEQRKQAKEMDEKSKQLKKQTLIKPEIKKTDKSEGEEFLSQVKSMVSQPFLKPTRPHTLPQNIPSTGTKIQPDLGKTQKLQTIFLESSILGQRKKIEKANTLIKKLTLDIENEKKRIGSTNRSLIKSEKNIKDKKEKSQRIKPAEHDEVNRLRNVIADMEAHKRTNTEKVREQIKIIEEAHNDLEKLTLKLKVQPPTAAPPQPQSMMQPYPPHKEEEEVKYSSQGQPVPAEEPSPAIQNPQAKQEEVPPETLSIDTFDPDEEERNRPTG